jgi:predicted metalloprotease with PDZ domain
MTTIRYAVRFPDPQTHYISVAARFPAEGQASIEVFMPVWTPGSYLIREYSRNVEGVAASGDRGQALPCIKSRKNRWRIETGGAREIQFSYRVYCREMSVRTNWVESSFALLNGAPTFIAPVDGLHLPHEVQLELPSGWKTSITGLAESPGGALHHYMAPDYETLVDSPILAGNPAVYCFDFQGVPHYLANLGEEGVWDGPGSMAALAKIVERQHAMWGSLPYTKYVFLNLLTETSGGLEHGNSACLLASRWATRTRRAYVDWLSLASHEYFHVWNIKRLRPVELGPFDYENENLTRSLWVAEGLTEYYGSLMVHRAGLSTRLEYLGNGGDQGPDSLSKVIERLQTTPGRKVQSAEESSWDAWIKLYRPDENSRNTSISYYTKGAVVGWLLDARIRRATNGAKSLEDLMRLTFSRYSGERGFSPDEFKAAADEVAGTSLTEFFRRSVESTAELDYAEALDWFGLRFRQPPEGAKKAWLGAETKVDQGRLVIARVPRETPAFDGGLNVDDELIALDGFRVRADRMSQRLENYHPGEKVSLLVARREKLMRMDVVFGEEPAKKWQLEIQPEASAEQKQHLDAWLGPGV